MKLFQFKNLDIFRVKLLDQLVKIWIKKVKLKNLAI